MKLTPGVYRLPKWLRWTLWFMIYFLCRITLMPMIALPIVFGAARVQQFMEELQP